MLKSSQLVNLLKKENLNFITGVPCSIFKHFLDYINKVNKIKHISATSEGEACAIAAGYYLSTSRIPIVYMQNSGLGNSVNPLTSLLNKEAYNIPALLLISWRGEPGKKDEPEHTKMGQITLKLLKILDIPYTILSEDKIKAEKEFNKANQYLKRNKLPYAIIIRKGIIKPHQIKKVKNIYSLTREDAIKTIVDKLKNDDAVISTTGKTSRELFEYRDIKKQNHKIDFYIVGSMGCSSGLSLGIALNNHKRIFLIDGDGSILMKMGTLATIGKYKPKKFIHIVIDNSVYGSTGGQPTSSSIINWKKLFLSLGYKKAIIITNKKQLIDINFEKIDSPLAVIIKVNQEYRRDIGRPTLTPIQIKENFMKFLKD